MRPLAVARRARSAIHGPLVHVDELSFTSTTGHVDYTGLSSTPGHVDYTGLSSAGTS
jgi:hypothetical protein